MSFDDNAMFRRLNVAELRDYAQEDPREAEAAEHGLNYVALDGDIGCIINGAGLAMATMDMIKHAGGEPANFLDIGGGASPDRVAAAFRLVLSDKNVRAILVNVFAGINRCDWVAQGVVQAVREVRVPVPLVVRLAGTNVEEGRRILKESGLQIHTADTLSEAAERVVTITDGVPAQDMIRVKRYLWRYAKDRRTTLIGPNCAGVISAGRAMMGIMPGHIYTRGAVGVVTRSGTLGYEAASQMKALGVGITTSVGIGGDPINGSSFVDMLALFEQDPETKAVVMIGEIGGPQEADAAMFVKEQMTKPVIGYVAGLTAPKGRRMGHAGAIISAFGDTAAEKAEIMRSAGLTVAPSPAELGSTVAEALARQPSRPVMVER